MAQTKEYRKEYRRAYYLANKEKHSIQGKEYKKRNSERLKARAKEYAKVNADQIKRSAAKHYLENKEKVNMAVYVRRLNKAGWSLELYDQKFKEQDGKCEICGEPEVSKRLSADHEHTFPPKPRGLLCGKHNRLLGYANDKISILEASIAYLKKYKTQNG